MSGVAASLGVNQAVLCFGLLTGATLGGNLSPSGGQRQYRRLRHPPQRGL